MFYAYIRVSTDTQTVENQRFAIEEYCKENSMKIHKWTNETISGKIDVQQRKLGRLMSLMKNGDTLVCSEISRLGRDMLMIMSILNKCVLKNIRIIAIKGNYRFENNISSKIFAMAYSISSELEKDFISLRTRDALARKKAQGVILGRPKGAKSKNRKLLGKESEIRGLIEDKVSVSEIAGKLNVNKSTVYRFIKDLET